MIYRVLLLSPPRYLLAFISMSFMPFKTLFMFNRYAR
jgi:hypothetical protein